MARQVCKSWNPGMEYMSQTGGRMEMRIFSRVLRDSTPRYVGPAVGRSVGRSSFYFLVVFELLEHTAPSQMP